MNDLKEHISYSDTIEWYGYGTERIARFRPQSDQRNMPVLTDFAATPDGMLLNDNSSLVQYPITIVYGKGDSEGYVYRKDYLEHIDTVPEIPDTLARQFIADYETTVMFTLSPEENSKM